MHGGDIAGSEQNLGQGVGEYAMVRLDPDVALTSDHFLEW